jgi:hypothetical protein
LLYDVTLMFVGFLSVILFFDSSVCLASFSLIFKIARSLSKLPSHHGVELSHLPIKAFQSSLQFVTASHAHQQSEGFKEIRMRGIAAAGWLFFVGLIGTARGQLDVHALSGCSETGKNQPTMKFVAVEAGGPSHFLYGASFTRLTEITSTNIAWSQLTEGGIPYWKNSKTNETTLVLMEYTNVDEGHLGFYIFGGDGGNAANETNIDSLKSGLWNLAYEDERGWHWDKFMIYTEVPARRRSGTSNVINGERSMIIFGGEYARPSCETLIGKAISPSTFQLLASNSATTAAGCRSACKANTTCTSWQLKSGSCQLSLFAGTVLYVDFIGASSGEMCTPANSMQYLNDMWHFDFTLEEYTNIYALTSTADGVFPDGAPILAEDRPAGRLNTHLRTRAHKHTHTHAYTHTLTHTHTHMHTQRKA